MLVDDPAESPLPWASGFSKVTLTASTKKFAEVLVYPFSLMRLLALFLSSPALYLRRVCIHHSFHASNQWECILFCVITPALHRSPVVTLPNLASIKSYQPKYHSALDSPGYRISRNLIVSIKSRHRLTLPKPSRIVMARYRPCIQLDCIRILVSHTWCLAGFRICLYRTIVVDAVCLPLSRCLSVSHFQLFIILVLKDLQFWTKCMNTNAFYRSQHHICTTTMISYVHATDLYTICLR